MSKLQDTVKRIIPTTIQSFLLTHALRLWVFGYSGSLLDLLPQSTLRTTFTLCLFFVLILVKACFRNRLCLDDNLITIAAWFAFALTLGVKSSVFSVLLGLILISVALITYLERWRVYLAVPIGLLLLRGIWVAFSGEELPEIFSQLPKLPWVDTTTVIAFSVWILLTVIMAVLWRITGVFSRFVCRHGFKLNILILILAVSVHAVWSGLYLLARVRAFHTPSYDMGLFVQMFNYMLRTGAPLTTLERDGLLSHFAVHVSPIYYLLLPLFALFPRPETLQLSQILVVASGVIPFLLLAKEWGVNKKSLPLWGAFFLVQPGLILSNWYDLHENIFLTPLLLWLIYFLRRGRYWGIAISALLLLMVKEDAGLYLIAVALYLLAGRKDSFVTKLRPKAAAITSAALATAALTVFGIAIYFLKNHGTGAMTGRFGNLMLFPELGLPGVVITAISKPELIITTIFVTPKFNYLLVTLSALGFLPLFVRRRAFLPLWLPFLVMNLMSNYQYQYNMGFQYNYGSHTLLSVLALGAYTAWSERSARSEIPQQIKKRSSPLAFVSVLLSLAIVMGLVQSGLQLKKKTPIIIDMFEPHHRVMREDLSKIPRDVIVVADSFLTTELADIPELYDIDYYDLEKERPSPDLIVLKRSNYLKCKKLPVFLSRGYTESSLSGSEIIVFQKPEP